ncbi:MAG: barstar family protein [Planctomycetia bacterium]|nr:barstar family protein [Planctomycetia bacterium]
MKSQNELHKKLYYSAERVFVIRSNNLSLISKEIQEELLFNDRLWIIDGNRCRTERGIFREFHTTMFFPEPVCDSWDAMIDWLSDLSWVNYIDERNASITQSHFIIIRNATRLGELNDGSRRIFFNMMSDFENARWKTLSRSRKGVFRFILACPNSEYSTLRSNLTEYGIPYSEIGGVQHV